MNFVYQQELCSAALHIYTNLRLQTNKKSLQSFTLAILYFNLCAYHVNVESLSKYEFDRRLAPKRKPSNFDSNYIKMRTPPKRTSYFYFCLSLLLGLLLIIINLLSRGDALHVRAKLVDGLHPFVVLV